MNGTMVDLIKVLLPLYLCDPDWVPEGTTFRSKTEFAQYIILKAEDLFATALENMEFPKPESDEADLERSRNFITMEANQYEWR